MKKFTLLASSLLVAGTSWQLSACTEKVNKPAYESISLTATLHTLEPTKEGVYLDGYVLEIDADSIKKFLGKKLLIQGQMVVHKGINPNDSILSQGREIDMRHILNPTIVVLDH